MEFKPLWTVAMETLAKVHNSCLAINLPIACSGERYWAKTHVASKID